MAHGFDEQEILRRLGVALSGSGWRRWLPAAIVALILLIGVFSSTYTVEEEGVAVVKRFGDVIDIEDPGLHFKLPFGIDRATFVPTRRVLKAEFGFRTVQPGRRTDYAKTSEHEHESLMLTGDLNVIDVEWVVQYRITDPDKWLHRVRDQEQTVRDVCEAVMRRIVGNRLGSEVLTVGRKELASGVLEELRSILGDSYDMGVTITNVEMQDVTPPDSVKPSFNDVNESRQEKKRLINEAEAKRNEEIPLAKGEAKQTVTEAEGAAAERVNRAKGDVARFNALFEVYKQVPDLTRRRLYLEMIDTVLPKVGKVYVVEKGQPAPLPLLNLETGSTRRQQESSQ